MQLQIRHCACHRSEGVGQADARHRADGSDVAAGAAVALGGEARALLMSREGVLDAVRIGFQRLVDGHRMGPRDSKDAGNSAADQCADERVSPRRLLCEEGYRTTRRRRSQ